MNRALSARGTNVSACPCVSSVSCLKCTKQNAYPSGRLTCATGPKDEAIVAMIEEVQAVGGRFTITTLLDDFNGVLSPSRKRGGSNMDAMEWMLVTNADALQ